MRIMNKEELIEKYGGIKWISPYEKVVAMFDGELIELHEFHARNRCIGGSAWEVYHYPRVSDLVVSARREGARNIFVLKEGKKELKLIPGIAGAGIESAFHVDDKIEITYAGLAGGGIAATVCRGLADGVEGIEIISLGGGEELGRAKIKLPLHEKVVIGVDDTDSSKGGATWSLVNEISFEAEKNGLGHYLMHSIVQLYTKTPEKTTNCVSISVTFATKNKNKLIDFFKKSLEENTYSTNTAMAVYSRIGIPEELKEYGRLVKSKIVTLDETERVAEEQEVKLIPITGKRGLIGAVAAIAFSDDPDEAVKVYA